MVAILTLFSFAGLAFGATGASNPYKYQADFVACKKADCTDEGVPDSFSDSTGAVQDVSRPKMSGFCFVRGQSDAQHSVRLPDSSSSTRDSAGMLLVVLISGTHMRPCTPRPLLKVSLTVGACRAIASPTDHDPVTSAASNTAGRSTVPASPTAPIALRPSEAALCVSGRTRTAKEQL